MRVRLTHPFVLSLALCLGLTSPKAHAQTLKINLKPLLDYFDQGWEKTQRIVLLKGTYVVGLDPRSQALPGCTRDTWPEPEANNSSSQEAEGGLLDDSAAEVPPPPPSANPTGIASLDALSLEGARYKILSYDLARSTARANFRSQVEAYCNGVEQIELEIWLKSGYAEQPTRHAYTFRLDSKGPYIQLAGVGKLYIVERD